MAVEAIKVDFVMMILRFGAISQKATVWLVRSSLRCADAVRAVSRRQPPTIYTKADSSDEMGTEILSRAFNLNPYNMGCGMRGDLYGQHYLPRGPSRRRDVYPQPARDPLILKCEKMP
jgi:hypothetical protein